MPNQEIRLGTLTLQPDRQLLANGAPLRLSRKPLQILSALAQARDELVTKEELMEAVWPNQVLEESALQVHIVALRKALGPEAGRLKTVHGFGYRLELSDMPAASPSVPSASTQHASIAVLPFANLTGDSNRNYLAEGLAEELISTLSHDKRLKVVSRTSSFAYRSGLTDVREIGRQLGVETIVEGSVRESGDRIRLTIQLIEATSGFHLWSGNFERALGDLLDLQDALARAVAAALGHELVNGRRPTHHPEAMRLHLQARSVAAQLSVDSLPRAEALLRRALELDPGFNAARVTLAFILLSAVSFGAVPFQRREEARREAERALAHDPELTGAQSVIACLHALQGEWIAARRHFTAALQRSQNDPLLHEAFAHFVLLPTGAYRSASFHAERSLELAPARANASYWRGLCGMMSGEYAVALDYLEMAVALGIPAQFPLFRLMRGACLLLQGRSHEAGEEVASALPNVARRAGGMGVARLVYPAILGIGNRQAASARVTALFDICRDTEELWADSSLAGLLYGWQSCLGALDEAYRVADAVVDRRRRTGHLNPPILISMWLPALASFRADPRFHSFVAALNMPEYWAEAGPPDGYLLRDGKLSPSDVTAERS